MFRRKMRKKNGEIIGVFTVGKIRRSKTFRQTDQENQAAAQLEPCHLHKTDQGRS